MKNISTLIYIFILVSVISCSKVEVTPGSMQAYVNQFEDNVEIHGVIACAANGAATDTVFDIFFYPIEGANNYKYFETSGLNSDYNNYNIYNEYQLQEVNVFNGYLKKFIREVTQNETWGIVTFEKDSRLYISDPIRNRPNTVPTEVNASLITVNENGITPSFMWQDGVNENNDIYFQVISKANGDLVSGTYTREKNFTFYDVSNVVLDINEDNIPTLETNSDYTFTLMAVDDDNWVNLLAQKSFNTN